MSSQPQILNIHTRTPLLDAKGGASMLSGVDGAMSHGGAYISDRRSISPMMVSKGFTDLPNANSK